MSYHITPLIQIYTNKFSPRINLSLLLLLLLPLLLPLPLLLLLLLLLSHLTMITIASTISIVALDAAAASVDQRTYKYDKHKALSVVRCLTQLADLNRSHRQVMMTMMRG